ncbi:MAG: o-succinylbenzoate--CoA ligase [Rhodothermales bacterium]
MIECPLKAAALEDPDLPAVVAPDGSFTYAELDSLVDGTAVHFERHGRRVAFQLENGWRSVVLLLAGIRAGRTVCPISTRLPAEAARNQALAIGAAELGNIRFDVGKGENRVEIPDDRPSTIVFTSGSSGEAKGALHTFANHYYSAAGSNLNIPVERGDRWLLSLPLYHVGGIAIVFRCLQGRGAIILSKKGRPMDEVVAASGATHVSMVSTQLRRFLEGAGGTTSLKCVLLGGSSIPPDLIRRAHSEGLPIHTSYGLTEMASQVTTTAPGASLEEIATSGAVLPFRELRVSADGEILVRGKTRFAGYVNGDGLSTPFVDGGWFPTRDLGFVDAAGRLHVRGRMDNLFISGGENVIPEEIEAAMLNYPAVLQAVVVPLRDEEFGERPVAFVDTIGGIQEAGLRDFLAEVLPRFKIPDRFFPWPHPEEGPPMKPNRADFKRRAEKLTSGSI